MYLAFEKEKAELETRMIKRKITINMQGFYNLSEKIRQTLQLDDFVNTVTYGDIYDVDLNKQTIFPLSHFMINSATMQGNVWNFSLSLLCMDIVDESKNFAEGIPQ